MNRKTYFGAAAVDVLSVVSVLSSGLAWSSWAVVSELSDSAVWAAVSSPAEASSVVGVPQAVRLVSSITVISRNAISLFIHDLLTYVR